MSTRHDRWGLILVVSAAFGLLMVPALADHIPIGPVEPSNEEQAGIYELNMIRSNPPAYGQKIGLDLSGVASQPPLAVNKNLTGSARFHAKEMLDHDYFSHTSPVSGKGSNQMAVDHGYDLFGSGLDKNWGTVNNIESNAYGFNRIPTYPEAIELLIIDEGVPSLGHRAHLLATYAFYQKHREVGCGRAASGMTRLYSIHTGYQNESDLFVTGTVFQDANNNLRHDFGEGLGGVTVGIGNVSVQTMLAGGYRIPVTPGQYTATCSGGGFQGVSTVPVTVTDSNVEVDFHSDVQLGEVNFAFQYGAGVPEGPTVDIPGQTIQAGQSFTAVTLDDYVDDVDNTDSEINWSYSGNSELTVSINNRVATIGVPHANWTGSETIMFTATDPYGLSDSDPATFAVRQVSQYVPCDRNEDGIVGDFELLDHIDRWAQGQVGDFELLDCIDLWAAGHYYWDESEGKFKPGEQP
jgi:hypothetical protein